MALEAPVLTAVVYLLGLLAAAFSARARAHANDEDGCGDTQSFVGGPPLRVAVVVPAHNEEAGVARAIGSIRSAEYPDGLLSVIVVADNCTDATAREALAAGAEVLTRTDERRRGKGYALGWAFEQLLRKRPMIDVYMVVDADCEVSANLITAMAKRFQRGATALQAAYTVANQAESTETALRFAAFSLFNVVRPWGKERLGLSCGLLGTGMAFSRDLLSRVPWQATSLTEDREYHMQIVEAGGRVSFVSEASVSSPMPTRSGATAEQRARWEGGKLATIRRWTPRLVGAGIAQRDLVKLHAGAEELVLPQSLIAAFSGSGLLLGLIIRSRKVATLALMSIAGQVGFVVGGLFLVRAPARVFRALLAAPLLIARQVRLYADLLSGRTPSEWVRTVRG